MLPVHYDVGNIPIGALGSVVSLANSSLLFDPEQVT